MYSLYRAHSTGAKGFHKRATQQGKQYKKAGTLFCGNGQNSTLRLPQHSRIYTQVSLQGECVLLDLAGLLSTEFMDLLACGPHPSIAFPTTPGGVEPRSPEITRWSPRMIAGGDSRTPSRAAGSCAFEGISASGPWGLRTSFTIKSSMIQSYSLLSSRPQISQEQGGIDLVTFKSFLAIASLVQIESD